MTGFKQTAEFFQLRAKKSRDPDRQHRLMEQAAFYRQLASIVPGFPPGYHDPDSTGRKWRDRAEECRTIAESLRNADCRRRLIALAEQCDRMAGNND